MKRIGFLYDKAFSKENISKAIDEAAKRKRKRRIVIKVLANKEKYIDEIYEMMKNDSFVPSPYTVANYEDGIHKKKRVIYKPRFYPDQIVHWCIYLVIRDYVYKSLIKTTCASIKGRGQIYGIKIIKKWLEDKHNTKYYLKMDIHHYYPSVNNDILISYLHTKIKDERFISLIKSILDLESGLPIGMLLSQIFANCYLSNLDHKLLEEKHVRMYMRYNDDMVIFGPNKRELHKLRLWIVDELNKVDLHMKPNWQVFKIDKEMLDFMGFRLNHEKCIIRKKIMYRITRRARRYKKNPTYHRACGVVSDYGFIKYSDSQWFYKNRIRPYVNYGEAKDIIRRKANENIQK